jgi:hypothetical protein
MPRLLVAMSFALLMSGLCGIRRMEASPRSQVISPENGKHFEQVVLQYLWPALDYGKIAGRIYYTAVCRPNENIGAAFPRLDVRPPPEGKVGLAAVRNMFQHAKNTLVTGHDPGIIRIRIGSVPNDLLRVKISRLVLTSDEQYNYFLAMVQIQNEPEVRSAMQKLEISPRAVEFIMPVAPPVAGAPHLPALITNVTMDQALDLVAKTFGGVVIYEFCTSGTQFRIDFANW